MTKNNVIDQQVRNQRWGRIVGVDEVLCHNAIGHIVQDMQKAIVMNHKGSTELKEQLVFDLRRMRQALQGAIIEGGRGAFDQACNQWEGHVLFPEFMHYLDSWLTRMPAPRKRPNQTKIPARGLGVYFYHDED